MFAHMTSTPIETQTVAYRFSRDPDSPAGSMSANRASTDAMGAVANWELAGPDRSYEVLVDEDDELVVRLSFLATQRDQAGHDLNARCARHGVTRALA